MAAEGAWKNQSSIRWSCSPQTTDARNVTREQQKRCCAEGKEPDVRARSERPCLRDVHARPIPPSSSTEAEKQELANAPVPASRQSPGWGDR